MSHVLVGFHHNTHRGQDIPALVRYGHPCPAIPICLDFLPIGGSHNNGAGNAVALLDMSEILNHRSADNFEKLLTIVGNGLPVFNG